MRLWRVFLVLCAACVLLAATTFADDVQHSGSVWLSAGMGVNYHNAEDLVNRINGSGVVTQRVSDFKSGVEFFGAVAVPLSPDWHVKLEYSYLLASYTLATTFGNAEFTYSVHMPTLVAQYVLHDGGSYNFKTGIGVGYHFGTYDERFSVVQAGYTASGIGTLLELEGNTGLGDDIYAHLSTQLRWDFVGELKSASGAGTPGLSGSATMHFFSLGAKLGLSYYL